MTPASTAGACSDGMSDDAARFSGDSGATWTYADLDGTQNDYDTDQAGKLTVETP